MKYLQIRIPLYEAGTDEAAVLQTLEKIAEKLIDGVLIDEVAEWQMMEVVEL